MIPKSAIEKAIEGGWKKITYRRAIITNLETTHDITPREGAKIEGTGLC